MLYCNNLAWGDYYMLKKLHCKKVCQFTLPSLNRLSQIIYTSLVRRWEKLGYAIELYNWTKGNLPHSATLGCSVIYVSE